MRFRFFFIYSPLCGKALEAEPIHELQQGHCEEYEIPEPENEVNLIVQDVKWQHAYSVQILHSARGSK